MHGLWTVIGRVAEFALAHSDEFRDACVDGTARLLRTTKTQARQLLARMVFATSCVLLVLLILSAVAVAVTPLPDTEGKSLSTARDELLSHGLKIEVLDVGWSQAHEAAYVVLKQLEHHGLARRGDTIHVRLGVVVPHSVDRDAYGVLAELRSRSIPVDTRGVDERLIREGEARVTGVCPSRSPLPFGTPVSLQLEWVCPDSTFFIGKSHTSLCGGAVFRVVSADVVAASKTGTRHLLRLRGYLENTSDSTIAVRAVSYQQKVVGDDGDAPEEYWDVRDGVSSSRMAPRTCGGEIWNDLPTKSYEIQPHSRVAVFFTTRLPSIGSRVVSYHLGFGPALCFPPFTIRFYE